MKTLSVFLTLCTILTLSQAVPLNSTVIKFGGLCQYKRQHCHSFFSTFCPECDASGNFLPQQCSWSWTDSHCWCVDVITGVKIPNTDTPLGTPSAHCDNSWYCPEGWFNFGERCYSFINTPKTWLEAEIYCQFDDANLASVHSEEENRFIMSLTRGDTHSFPQTWLGAFDVIHPGYWIWSDGTIFNYKNWYDRQPYGKDDSDKDHESHQEDDSQGDHHHDNHHEDDDDHYDQHHEHDSHHEDDDDHYDHHHENHHEDGDHYDHHHDHDSHHEDDDDHNDHHHEHDSHHEDDDDHKDHQQEHDSHHEDDDDHYDHHHETHDEDGDHYDHHHEQDSHHEDDNDHDNHHDDDDKDDHHHENHHEDDDNHYNHHNYDNHHEDDDDHDHNSHHDDDDDHKDEKKNCLRINYEYDLKWFYTSCADSLPFVCSKRAEANI